MLKFDAYMHVDMEKPQNHSDFGASVLNLTNTCMYVDIEKPQNHSRFGAKVLKFDTYMHVDMEKPQNHKTTAILERVSWN